MSRPGPVLALSGGVGGAKLAAGLAASSAADRLVVVANVADDFRHLGLHVSPDLDSNMYALAGVNNEELGWGRAGETWRFMEALGQLGGPIWFRLGDTDLATHLRRTTLLADGRSLSGATDALRRALGVAVPLIPATDDPVATRVNTPNGELEFQRYFVELRCEPAVTGFRFEGIEAARPSPGFAAALAAPDLAAIVICPSNPYVSVDPILRIPGVREALRANGVPIVAVSPIVGGRAIKGPAGKMMRELGLPVTPAAIAAHYGDLLDGFVLDERDAASLPEFGALPCLVTDTVMSTRQAGRRLAEAVLLFAQKLRR